MNAKAFLFWTGVSLGAHLALFALWPTLRPPSGTAGTALPVHLVVPRAVAPSPPKTLPPAVVPSAATGPPSPRPQTAPPPSPLPDLPPRPPASTPVPLPALSSPPSPLPSRSLEKTSAAPAEPPAAEASSAPAAVAAPKGIVPAPPGAPADRSLSEEPAQTVLPMETAAPLYEHNPPPPYPRLAQERGWEGEVLLRVRVSVAGEAQEVTVEKSSGRAVLDRAAREAVQRWRFRPGRQGGMAVASEVMVPIRFRLDG